MTAFRDFRDINAWQLAHALNVRVDIFLHSPDFRRHYMLCNELRDAARSGPHRIAEGHARLGNREFAQCVRAASQAEAEVLNHLIEARDQRLITADEFSINAQLVRRAMRAAARLIRDLESAPDAPSTSYALTASQRGA